MQITRRNFTALMAAFFGAMSLPVWMRLKPKPTYLVGKDAFFCQNLNANQKHEYRTYLVGQDAIEIGPASYNVTLIFGPPPDVTQRIRARASDAV